MGILLVDAVNTLNEKGLRYKAIELDGHPVFQFGIAVPDLQKAIVSKEVIEVSPRQDAIVIKLMGKEKEVDSDGFETFVEGVVKFKALQEEEAKLFEKLTL